MECGGSCKSGNIGIGNWQGGGGLNRELSGGRGRFMEVEGLPGRRVEEGEGVGKLRVE